MCSRINTIVIPSCSNYEKGICLHVSDIEEFEIPCRAVMSEDCEVKEVLEGTEVAYYVYAWKINESIPV